MHRFRSGRCTAIGKTTGDWKSREKITRRDEHEICLFSGGSPSRTEQSMAFELSGNGSQLLKFGGVVRRTLLRIECGGAVNDALDLGWKEWRSVLNRMNFWYARKPFEQVLSAPIGHSQLDTRRRLNATGSGEIVSPFFAPR